MFKHGMAYDSVVWAPKNETSGVLIATNAALVSIQDSKMTPTFKICTSTNLENSTIVLANRWNRSLTDHLWPKKTDSKACPCLYQTIATIPNLSDLLVLFIDRYFYWPNLPVKS